METVTCWLPVVTKLLQIAKAIFHLVKPIHQSYVVCLHCIYLTLSSMGGRKADSKRDDKTEQQFQTRLEENKKQKERYQCEKSSGKLVVGH